MTAAAPPDRFAAALSYALERVWNDEAGYQRFSGTRCRRAGRAMGEVAFVCRSEVVLRHTGRLVAFRGVILADGTRVS